MQSIKLYSPVTPPPSMHNSTDSRRGVQSFSDPQVKKSGSCISELSSALSQSFQMHDATFTHIVPTHIQMVETVMQSECQPDLI